MECLEERCLLAAGYAQVNLASDLPGLARAWDPNLVNPWGLAFSPTGPFWFAENGTGVSDLLDGSGEPVPLVVTLPTRTPGSSPTGTVFNGGHGFAVSANGTAAPARFLFATEDGTIAGWSAAVDATRAVPVVDRSAAGAVYTGLTLATDAAGNPFLYAADFGRGRIAVFDAEFQPVEHPDAFRDADLPDGFAPFNIQNVNDLLVVTYARRDADGTDAVYGTGNGLIDLYDARGKLVRRFATAGALDAPWGLAPAPAGFGPFGGALLVGNNGDGRVNAYDLGSGAFLGPLTDADGVPVAIPGLWALTFGNGHLGGAADTLFFTAGVGDERHGLFGALQAPQRAGADTAGPGRFDPHAPGEPGDYPLPPRGGPALRDPAEDRGLVAPVLLPVRESSLLVVPVLAVVPGTGAGAGTRAQVPSGAVVAAASVGGPPPAGSSHPTPPTGSGTSESLALHAFLEISAAPAPAEAPGVGPPPDLPRDAVSASLPSRAGAEAAAEGLLAVPPGPSAGTRGEPVDVDDRESPTTEERSASTAVLLSPRTPEVGRAEGHAAASLSRPRSWPGLLAGFLVALSVPMLWATGRVAGGRASREGGRCGYPKSY